MITKLDKVCMSYWFPRISNLELLTAKYPIFKLPATKLYYFSTENIKSLLNGKSDYLDCKYFNQTVDQIYQTLDGLRKMGQTKSFIRSGVTSLKHDWENSCFIDLTVLTKEILINKIVELLYVSNAYANPTDTIVIREFIETDPLFTAFDGNMPITTELRCFAESQKGFYHYQPYWLNKDQEDEVFIKNTKRAPSKDNYKDILDKANYERLTDEVISELGNSAIEIVKYLGGDWSVDFLLGKDNKWYLIDIAPAKVSFKYKDFIPKEENLRILNKYTVEEENESLRESMTKDTMDVFKSMKGQVND